MKLIRCGCGHSFMEFVHKTDTWNCSKCKTQRADHTTLAHTIRRIPNTRGSRFALYDPQMVETAISSPPAQDEEAPETLDQDMSIDELGEQIELKTSKLTSVEKLRAYIAAAGVVSGMRLANSPSLLVPQLNLFFRMIEPYVNDARHQGLRWTQTEVSDALEEAGVRGATGEINNSKVCNCRRKAVLQCGPAYPKPDYKGHNWLAFR